MFRGRPFSVPVALTAVLGLLLCGCGGGTAAPASGVAGGGSRGDVTVFAASSLTDAFGAIGSAFQQAQPGVRVRFNYGASSTLRTQLEQGAPAGVFASADQAQMDQARAAGVIAGADRVFARNKLVVIVPADNPGKIASLQDLARPGLTLVLTDPSVPIGAYARAALEKMAADPAFGPDFAARVLANLKSQEPNVRAAVTKVQLGEADASIVYTTDLTPSVRKDVQSIPIPDPYNVIAAYPIAAVHGAPNPAAAAAFIAFVLSPAGQAILQQYGFITGS